MLECYCKPVLIVYLNMLKKGIHNTCFDCPEECDSIQYDKSHSFKIQTEFRTLTHPPNPPHCEKYTVCHKSHSFKIKLC